MAESHPYVSGAGTVVQAINQLRKSFPSTITAETFKKLGIALNNESYVINTLRFINVIDTDGKKTSRATKAFSHHQDDGFQKEFADLIKVAYKDLFEVYGDGAWTLEKDALITYFRQSDDTSAIVGGRQATVFLALAGLSGHRDVPEPKKSTGRKKQTVPKTTTNKKTASKSGSKKVTADFGGKNKDFGLTVRIEINLPADGDQATYDRIFKSIRENLLDG